MAHCAYRYRSGAKVLQHTIFATANSFFLGAHHGVETDDIYDAAVAAREMTDQIDSHKQDFAIAFGLTPEDIDVEMLQWDGEVPDGMTAAQRVLELYPDPSDALVRVPVERSPDQIAAEQQAEYEAAVANKMRELAENALSKAGINKPEAVEG